MNQSPALEAAPLGEDEFGQLVASILLSPIASIITDNRKADNPILEVNQAFLDLTGYEREEVLGRNCRFLAGAGTESDVRASIRSAIEEGRPLVAELLNYRKSGEPFRNALMIAPVRDRDGNISLFIGSQMEVHGADGSGALRHSRYRQIAGGLPRRLRQVLRLMCAGHQNRQIAMQLGISEKTVKMHRARLRKSLGVRTSAEAIRIGLEAGLLSESEAKD
jgi:PAS domain S-box-containing protein